MMSKCGHCGGFSWEIAEESPVGSNFKVNFVRCNLCKVPVGVMEYYNLHSTITDTEKKLKSELSSLDHLVRVIEENVRRLFHK